MVHSHASPGSEAETLPHAERSPLLGDSCLGGNLLGARDLLHFLTKAPCKVGVRSSP